VLAVLMLKVPPVVAAFRLANSAVEAIAAATRAGTSFAFGYVGGGVFLGAAVVSAIVLRPWATPSPRERGRVTLVPVVGPGGGGGALLGRF
jgi:hypothetical protein